MGLKIFNWQSFRNQQSSWNWMWPEFDRSLNCKKKRDDGFWLLGPRIVSGKHLPQELSLLLELNSHKFEDLIHQRKPLTKIGQGQHPAKSSKHPSFVARDLCCNLIFPTVPKLEQKSSLNPVFRPSYPPSPTGEGNPGGFFPWQTHSRTRGRNLHQRWEWRHHF